MLKTTWNLNVINVCIIFQIGVFKQFLRPSPVGGSRRVPVEEPDGEPGPDEDPDLPLGRLVAGLPRPRALAFDLHLCRGGRWRRRRVSQHTRASKVKRGLSHRVGARNEPRRHGSRSRHHSLSLLLLVLVLVLLCAPKWSCEAVPPRRPRTERWPRVAARPRSQRCST